MNLDHDDIFLAMGDLGETLEQSPFGEWEPTRLGIILIASGVLLVESQVGAEKTREMLDDLVNRIAHEM